MKFYASVPPKSAGEPPSILIIDAESAYDAHAYALATLGEEGLLFQPTGDDAVADVELRWVGDDFNAGATLNGRRLQVLKHRVSPTLLEH